MPLRLFIVSFESWGDFLDRVTKLKREDLQRAPFDQDPVFQDQSPGLGVASQPEIASDAAADVIDIDDYRHDARAGRNKSHRCEVNYA